QVDAVQDRPREEEGEGEQERGEEHPADELLAAPEPGRAERSAALAAGHDRAGAGCGRHGFHVPSGSAGLGWASRELMRRSKRSIAAAGSSPLSSTPCTAAPNSPWKFEPDPVNQASGS